MEMSSYVPMITETEYQLELELDENYDKEFIDDATNELAELMLEHYESHSIQFQKYENFLKHVTIKNADVQTIKTAVDKFKKLMRCEKGRERLEKIKGENNGGNN